MKSLSILIPIYNEEESLQALFDELKFSFEIINQLKLFLLMMVRQICPKK